MELFVLIAAVLLWLGYRRFRRRRAAPPPAPSTLRRPDTPSAAEGAPTQWSAPSPVKAPSDRPIVFLDVETTGLESYARVVTLGMVWSVGREFDAMHLVFDPRTDCNPEAAAIHGWDDWTLRFQDLFVDHAPAIHAVIARASAVVAHNAAFDIRFLEREFRKVGLEWPDVPVYCTMEMARERWPGQRAGLDQCLARVGARRQGRRHGALEDAWLAMHLFAHLDGRPPPPLPAQLPAPVNLRPAPPRPEGELPRRAPKRRRKVEQQEGAAE